MKEEILKIMDMNKKGLLNDEQAAELLSQLQVVNEETTIDIEEEVVIEKDGSANGPSGFDFNLDLSGLGKFVNNVVNKAMEEVDKGLSEIKISEEGENSVNLSKYAAPKGEDFRFEDNNFQISNIKDIELNSSELADCSFQAANINGLKVTGGHLLNCEFHGSSIERFAVNNTELDDVEFHGSKASKLNIIDSNICDTEFHGSSLKELAIKKNSQFRDIEFHGCSITHTNWGNIKLDDVKLQGLTIKDCNWENVDFSDCQLNNLKLVDCHLKNISLSNLSLQDRNLEGQLIDGNEAFLKALEASPLEGE
ncbi:MAG: pentapeptide repeat-containing protein [Halobacteriovoraceae bacterium]|jgi:uncharacterized protein YjbI with pentapeptide repeats|nr:pentapeptide repeat-containing protein [Halobacteriovoraceae bacterium]MBT5093987.1 pentapeptide repeat-containing protein [Halobacteriovoraceae bacterium]